MSRVTLSQPVRYDEQITTCAELLDKGIAIVRKTDRFDSPRSPTGMRTAYFVQIIGTNSCYEIGQRAYESRLSQTEATLKDREER